MLSIFIPFTNLIRIYIAIVKYNLPFHKTTYYRSSDFPFFIVLILFSATNDVESALDQSLAANQLGR